MYKQNWEPKLRRPKLKAEKETEYNSTLIQKTFSACFPWCKATESQSWILDNYNSSILWNILNFTWAKTRAITDQIEERAWALCGVRKLRKVWRKVWTPWPGLLHNPPDKASLRWILEYYSLRLLSYPSTAHCSKKPRPILEEVWSVWSHAQT